MSPGGCDANCDSAGARTGRHSLAQNDETRSSHSDYRGFVGDHAGFRKPANGQHRIRTCDLHGVNVAL